MRNTLYSQSPRQQQGAVLIISLILLVLMTIIGVTAMRTTTLQERMAGNMRSYDIAFQAAESALREGESRLRIPPPGPTIEDISKPPNLWVWSLNKIHPDYTAVDKDLIRDEISSWWNTRQPWWECTTGVVKRDTAWWKSTASYSYEIIGQLIDVTALPRYLIEHQAYVRDNIGMGDYSEPGTGRDYFRVTARAEGSESSSVIFLQSVFAWRYN